MGHYFENEQDGEITTYTYNYTYHGQNLSFVSYTGVFSKQGIDFGSNLLLNSLPSFPNEKVLDLGCGMGVVGCCLAKANPTANVVMSDVKKLGVLAANQNIVLNKITNAKAIESFSFANIKELFHSIITNPPIRAGKKVVYQMLSDSFDHLYPGGKLFVVVQKKQGAPSMAKFLENMFGNIDIVNKKNGYFVFMCKKVE